MAAASPPQPVLPVLPAPVGDELLRIINRIARELMNYFNVPESEMLIQEQRAAGAGQASNPIVITPGAGNLGAIRDIRSHISGRQAGRTEHMVLPGGIPVTEQVSRARLPIGQQPRLGNIEVTPGAGLDYERFLGRLNTIRQQTGAGEVEIAEGLRNITQGRPLPRRLAQHPTAPAVLGSLNRTLMLEGARMSTAIVQGRMLLDLVSSGQTNFSTAFSGFPVGAPSQPGGRGFEGGDFPPTQDRASAANRRIETALGFQPTENLRTPPPGINNPRVQEQRRRQIEFATRWVQMRMRNLHFDFNSQAEIEAYIRTELEAALRLSLSHHFDTHPFNIHLM
jgi:hypothetical protein